MTTYNAQVLLCNHPVPRRPGSRESLIQVHTGDGLIIGTVWVDTPSGCTCSHFTDCAPLRKAYEAAVLELVDDLYVDINWV